MDAKWVPFFDVGGPGTGAGGMVAQGILTDMVRTYQEGVSYAQRPVSGLTRRI